MLMSPVLPARMPSLPWSVPVVRPVIPRSSMNAVTPLCFFDRSTEAKTRKWSAMSARLIQIFSPLRTYESPSRRAVDGEVRGVRADARLGQPERRQLLALGLGHEPALLLLVGRPLQERQRVEPDVDALDDPEGRVGPLQLLAEDGEADVVHARAAPLLGDRRAEEPELGHPGEDLAVDLALLVPLADVRQDLGLDELADGLLDEAVLVGEAEVDHGTEARCRPVGRRRGAAIELAGCATRRQPARRARLYSLGRCPRRPPTSTSPRSPAAT